MNNTDEIILGIVEESLGLHRKTRSDNPQKYFNCKSQKCKNDKNKYNLAFHAHSKVFKCWKCGAHGSVYTLVKIFGNQRLIEQLKLILPYYNNQNGFLEKNNIDYDSLVCELPKEYLPLWEKRDTFKYKQALNYVINERKLTLQEIKENKIGYTEDGPKKLRIIIPSFNKKGEINYYEARSYWKEMKQAYMKPDFPDKDDIIFNEKFINWNLPVFLVEGYFDSKRIPNSIPMLGKKPSPLIIRRVLENNSKVILCLDEDALKDCYEIFNLFASLGIDVYYIDMNGLDDVSKVYENKGKDGIKEIMSRIKKLTLEVYINKLLKYEI